MADLQLDTPVDQCDALCILIRFYVGKHMPHGRERVNIISLKHDADKSNMLNTNYILKIPKLKTG